MKLSYAASFTLAAAGTFVALVHADPSFEAAGGQADGLVQRAQAIGGQLENPIWRVQNRSLWDDPRPLDDAEKNLLELARAHVRALRDLHHFKEYVQKDATFGPATEQAMRMVDRFLEEKDLTSAVKLFPSVHTLTIVYALHSQTASDDAAYRAYRGAFVAYRDERAKRKVWL